MRDSLIFYRSFMESFAELPDKERLTMYDAVIKYGLDGEDPELTGLCAALFKLVKPQMDANERRYQNGLKGGRKPNNNQSETKTKPKRNQSETKPKPNNNQTETKTEPNVNDNVNDNDNENGNASGSDDSPSSLISYLNQKAGSTYKTDKVAIDMILSQYLRGHSYDEMRAVVDKKCADWGNDDKMRAYLRPSTLFGPKFDTYLQEPPPIHEANKKNTMEKLNKELGMYKTELSDIDSALEQVANVPDRDESKWDTLSTRRGFLLDQIDRIEGILAKG